MLDSCTVCSYTADRSSSLPSGCCSYGLKLEAIRIVEEVEYEDWFNDEGVRRGFIKIRLGPFDEGPDVYRLYDIHFNRTGNDIGCPFQRGFGW